MKKIIFVSTLLFFAFTASYAQSFHLGLKAGATMNKLEGQPFSDAFTYGYQAGAYADIGVGSKWAIHPEVLFSQTNVDTAYSFSTVYKFNNINHMKLNYLSIPILLEYKLSRIVALQAGPQFGILISQNDNLLQNGQNAFKQGNFSLAGGLQVKLLGLNIYGRYVQGLMNVNNTPNQDTWKNEAFQLGIGFNLL